MAKPAATNARVDPSSFLNMISSSPQNDTAPQMRSGRQAFEGGR
jgi:hypothetical protein